LSSLSGPTWLPVANVVLKAARESTELTWIPELAGHARAPCNGVRLLYNRLGDVSDLPVFRHSHQNWDGPVTVTVNELAKQDQESNPVPLARAELIRRLSRQPDPVAGNAAANWRKKLGNPPGLISIQNLSNTFNIFSYYFYESVIFLLFHL
jgi:hypothetical protein